VWLTKGDRNTHFFHAAASERRRRNTIKKLRRDDGTVVEGRRLKEFIANHYQNIFLSSAGHTTTEVLRSISPRITNEMNVVLTKPFVQEEIWEALQSIGDLKAPGPDGIPAVFLQKVLVHSW